MTITEAQQLKEGQRVRWTRDGDEDTGIVDAVAVQGEGGYLGIRWDHFRVGQVTPIDMRDAAPYIEAA